MAGLMHDAGFVDVKATPFKWWFGRSPNGDLSARVFITYLKNFAPFCLSLGDCDGFRTESDADEMIKACEDEVLKEPIYLDMVVSVGRRAP